CPVTVHPHCARINRMLKKSASGVLSSSKSSTYPRGYASGFDSPAALLDRHFEHPASWYADRVFPKPARGPDEVRDAVPGDFCGGCADGTVGLWLASERNLA